METTDMDYPTPEPDAPLLLIVEQAGVKFGVPIGGESDGGNADIATKLATPRTISLTGDVTGSTTFDGSANVTITTVIASAVGGVQLGSTAGVAATTNGTAGTAATAAHSDHSHPAQTTVSGNAGTATKLATARTIALSGGATGTATSFDGSVAITIPVTALDAAKLTGTASISTTGNAGTATKLATARTISLSGSASGSATFDGSANAAITVGTMNVNGTEYKVWIGTTAQLPATRTSGTLYFVS